MINPVVNARDAMAHKGTIEITTRPVTDPSDIPDELEGDAYVVIAVRDTGRGNARRRNP